MPGIDLPAPASPRPAAAQLTQRARLASQQYFRMRGEKRGKAEAKHKTFSAYLRARKIYDSVKKRVPRRVKPIAMSCHRRAYTDLNVRFLESRVANLCLLQALAEGVYAHHSYGGSVDSAKHVILR